MVVVFVCMECKKSFELVDLENSKSDSISFKELICSGQNCPICNSKAFYIYTDL